METKTGTQRLLEKALKVIQPGTKYGLAKRLGMSPSNLNAALSGAVKLGPKPSVLLAELLDLEPLDVLAVTQADAARSAADKEWWRRKVPRFLSAVALGLTVVGAGGGYLRKHGPNGPSVEPIYILRTKRRPGAPLPARRYAA